MTGRQNVLLDEYNMLTALNVAVAGWAEYYRYTSLLDDISEISWYTSMRYILWLRKKYRGKRKWQLAKAKTRVIFNTKRWTAKIKQKGKTYFAYQWHPTRKELKRERYMLKKKEGFPHPYLSDKC